MPSTGLTADFSTILAPFHLPTLVCLLRQMLLKVISDATQSSTLWGLTLSKRTLLQKFSSQPDGTLSNCKFVEDLAPGVNY